MEVANTQQFAPLQMSKPVIQALVTKELSGLKYKEVLQAVSNLSFTKDNLAPDYPALKELDRLLKLLDELRKKIQSPYYLVCTDTNAIFKDIVKPLEEVRDNKKAELKAANELAEIEKRQALAEQQRKENILTAIAQFINQVTMAVSSATSDTEITRIQKLVGSEKNKKSFYAEYYSELVDKCESLEQPIKDRKEFIREKARLDEEIKNADASQAVELKEQQELLEAQTKESSIRLQETAFEAASTIQTVVGEPMIETVKPKSRRWTWRVDDIQLLQKKMPHLVKLVPNDEAIDTLFRSKKAEGLLIDDEELKIFGLTIYQEKFY